MGIAYLYGNGGGGSGGNLSVTAPEGVVVTVSKDDKSYSKFVGTDGLAKFTGLESGTWTVSITDETQTATTTVNIKIDHSTTIAFFGATITVTFPTGSAECVCYCKDDPGIMYYATDEELAAGKAVFTVSKAGTWIVTCNDGIDTAQKEVTIASNGSSVSTSLSYHTYLYRAGDKCTSVTGGWKTHTVSGSNASYFAAGTVSFGTSSVTLNAPEKDGSYYTCVGIYTTNKINLANYKTLTVKASSAADPGRDSYVNAYGTYVLLYTSALTDVPSTSSAKAYVKVTGPGTFSINVESLTGTNANCYVCITAIDTAATFTEVYLD